MSVRVMAWVFWHATVKGAAWQVLVLLADAASDDGLNAYPSRQKIALKANLSEKAVREAWATLAAGGWIEPAGWSPAGTRSWRVVMRSDVPEKLTRAGAAARAAGTLDPGTVGTPGPPVPQEPDGADPGTDGLRRGDRPFPEPSKTHPQTKDSPRSATACGHRERSRARTTDHDIERVKLADDIVGVLQRGIDGLSTDERCKKPTRVAILEALAGHELEPFEARIVATNTRSIAQSQNRAPNIAALFAQRLDAYRKQGAV